MRTRTLRFRSFCFDSSIKRDSFCAFNAIKVDVPAMMRRRKELSSEIRKRGGKRKGEKEERERGRERKNAEL